MVPSFVRPCLLSFGYLNYKLFIAPCNTECFLFWKKILEVKRGVTVVHVAIFPHFFLCFVADLSTYIFEP